MLIWARSTVTIPAKAYLLDYGVHHQRLAVRSTLLSSTTHRLRLHAGFSPQRPAIDVSITKVMYVEEMRRLQISIEEDLDDALALEAVRTKTSKAALIRKFVRERLGGTHSPVDPMSSLIGDLEGEAGDIDATVYGA